MPPAPLSPYAANKVAAEAMLAAYAHSMNVDTVALRYFNIFGPRQSPDNAYAAVIAAFAKALAERPPPGHLRRRRAEPRLHLRRQRRPREPAGRHGRTSR